MIHFSLKRCAFFFICVACAVFFLFSNLGDRLLWQDEAEVAFLAKTFSEHGRPLAWDGRNVMAQMSGTEFDDQLVWRWSPWGTPLLAMVGARLFEPTPLGYRFPSAVFGLLTFLLSFVVAQRWIENPRVAMGAWALQLLAVPFFLHMRQCRYYAVVAFLGMLVLWFYPRLPRLSAAFGLAVTAAAMAYFNELSLLLLGASLFFYAVVFDDDRRRWKKLLFMAPLILLMALPQMFIHLGAGVEGKALRPLTLDLFGLRLLKGWVEWNSVVVPFLLLIAVWMFRRHFSTTTHRLTRLLTCFAIVGPLVISPFLDPNIRYAPYAFGLGMMLIALVLADLWRRSRRMALLVTLLVFGTNLVSIGPIVQRGDWGRTEYVGFVRELTTSYRGPNEAIVEFLREHAEEDDVVLATYEQLPLMIHTPFKLAYLLPRERGEELHLPRYTYDPLTADWFIPRVGPCFDCPPLDANRFLAVMQTCGVRVESFPLGVGDLKYGNSPNINYHAFVSPPPNKKELVIYGLTQPPDAVEFERCVQEQGGIENPG